MFMIHKFGFIIPKNRNKFIIHKIRIRLIIHKIRIKFIIHKIRIRFIIHRIRFRFIIFHWRCLPLVMWVAIKNWDRSVRPFDGHKQTNKHISKVYTEIIEDRIRKTLINWSINLFFWTYLFRLSYSEIQPFYLKIADYIPKSKLTKKY